MPDSRRHPIHGACALGWLLLATACGGGGGGGGEDPEPPPPTPPANSAPTAEAGAAQTAREGDRVTLTGSGTDSDGTIASFAWSQSAGVPVNLVQAPASATANFDVPDIDADGTATFTLTVTDDDGATDTDEVSIDLLANFRVAGTALSATGIDLDGDVNDPGTPLARNNDFDTAQPLRNPVLLGGFANQPAAGDPAGQLVQDGDVDDFYRIDAFAGQLVSLFIESERPFVNDLDLELYDSNRILIDRSISITSFEQLTIPADGGG
ncbi:MAG: PKD domain-containing protein [Pseudomonadota bacterium]